MSPVFCKECRHYQHLRACIHAPGQIKYDQCNHPDNWVTRQNHFCRWRERIDSPRKRNAHNDCGWFKRRRSVIDWLLGRNR